MKIGRFLHGVRSRKIKFKIMNENETSNSTKTAHLSDKNTLPKPIQISSISLPDRDKFYKDAEKYWASVEPTIDGMLGGLTELDASDCKFSLKMIEKFQKDNNTKYALDVGAGIGRVTKNVLLKKYNCVDMLEVDKKFLDKANEYLGESLSRRVGKFYHVGMQDFVFEKKYDVIWIQWCIAHLTDEDAKIFLKNAQKNLTKNGMIVVKDNMTSQEETPLLDEQDSSVTRDITSLVKLLKDSGLTIHLQELQKDFPIDGLLPVVFITCN